MVFSLPFFDGLELLATPLLVSPVHDFEVCLDSNTKGLP
jgi:hypothetical protein